MFNSTLHHNHQLSPNREKATVYFIQDAGTLHSRVSNNKNRDRWGMGRRKQEEFIFRRVGGTGSTICAAEETRTPWEHVGTRKFRGGGRKGVLLPHAAAFSEWVHDIHRVSSRR